MRKQIISFAVAAALICGTLPVEASASASDMSAQNASASVSNTSAQQNMKIMEAAIEETAAPTSSPIPADGVKGKIYGSSNDMSYSITADGVLTIEEGPKFDPAGDTAMSDSGQSTYTLDPWNDYASHIVKLIVKGRISEIGRYNFYKDYTNLKEIDISQSSVTTIDRYAFSGCTALDTITGIEKLQSIKNYCFEKTGFKEVAFEDLTDDTGAFIDCPNLKTVSMPKIITMGGGGPNFSGCTALEKVDLPQVTTFTSARMFQGCTSLKSISFPKLQKVEYGFCFDGCTNLMDVSLPSFTSCTVSLKLLLNCPNLLFLDAPNAVSAEGVAALDLSTSTKLIGVKGPFPPEASRKNLVWYDGSSISFSGASSLKRLYDESISVAALSTSAFNGLPEDLQIYVKSQEVKEGRWKNYPHQDKITVVSDFSTLKKENHLILEGPSEVAKDESPKTLFQAQRNDDSSASITLCYYKDEACATAAVGGNPKIVPTKGGEYYVRGETQDTDGYYGTHSNVLKYMQGGTVSSGYYTLDGDKTAGYTLEITDDLSAKNWSSDEEVPWNAYRTYINNVTFSGGAQSMKRVPDYAFNGCTALKSLTLPDTVVMIGAFAFAGCTQWKSEISLKNAELGEAALKDCASLSGSVEWSNTITEIPKECFMGTGIRTVTIPQSVRTFGKSCFQDSKVTALTIPEGVTSLSNYFASGCTELANITIPESCTSINDHAFYGCSALKEVRLPKVTSTGSYAFAECTSLNKVEVLAENPSRIGDSHCFENCTALATVVYPDTVSGSSVRVADYAFKGCTSLKQITIPQGVISVGKESFAGSGLTSISFPDSVKDLGEHAFQGDKALESVELSHVQNMKRQVFFNCTALKKVTLPDNEVSSEHLADDTSNSIFYGCPLSDVVFPKGFTTLFPSLFSDSGLKKIVIPETVTKIQGYKGMRDGLFSGCNNLEYVEFEKTDYDAESLQGTYCYQSVLGSGNTTDCAELMFDDCNRDFLVVADGTTYDILSTFQNKETGGCIDWSNASSTYAEWKKKINAANRNAGWDGHLIKRSNVTAITNIEETKYKKEDVFNYRDASQEENFTSTTCDFNSGTGFKKGGFIEDIRMTDTNLGDAAYLKLDFTADDAVMKEQDVVQSLFKIKASSHSIFSVGQIYSILAGHAAGSDGAYTAYVPLKTMFDSMYSDDEITEINLFFAQAEPEITLTGLTILTEITPEEQARQQLAQSIEEAAGMDLTGYTEESAANLKNALEAAKAIDENASLEEVNAALSALRDAVNGLTTEEQQARQQLAQSIEEAAGMDLTGYTEESATNLKNALEAAKAIDENASAEEVTQALNALRDAINGLVKKSEATPSPTPGTNNTPAPGPSNTPVPGPSNTPAPGPDNTPAPGGNVTPAPGGNQNQDTVQTDGLAKGKTFTAGSLKYQVTKAATITSVSKKKTAGIVTVVGLAKKTASSVSVNNTVANGSAFYQVTALGKKAFQNAKKLKKATLGSSIKTIPASAFAGCKKLTAVTAAGVTKIEKSAFKGDKALKKLTLKKKLVSVKKGAFKGCKKKIKVSGGTKKVCKANIKKLKKSGYKKFR